ncbi:MAG TPA: zf-HC2 domain-containing protein [Rudaea sp.]|nr:zf-HC2 domain-containing protein [Rudaea sp.]
MDCKTAIALLEPYLDNELDRADARELEAHVDGCADCAAALARLGDLRQALRDRALRHVAPPELRERIRVAAMGVSSHSADSPPHHDARRAGAQVPRRPWMAGTGQRRALPEWMRLAAACVLAFGAGGVSVQLWNTSQGEAAARTQLERDLFAGHWRALAAASPVDVVSSDRHTVKPWFAGKVAESPLVRDFAAQGFALVGGRLDYVGAERVAVLVYRHGQHLIDVFVMPRAGSGAAVPTAEQQGYTLTPVRLGSQPAVIVSDMDREERTRFAQLVESPP